MTFVEFCSRWFPLVITWEGQKYPIGWFENKRGVARIWGRFVVSVYPVGGRLHKPREKGSFFDFTVASTWDGLWVEIIEHSVGSIDKAEFRFEEYLKMKMLPPAIPNPVVSGVPLAELYQGMAVVVRDDYPKLPEDLPRYFWHLYEPLDTNELLGPMARYIEHWL